MLQFFQEGISPDLDIFGQPRHQLEIFNSQMIKDPIRMSNQ